MIHYRIREDDVVMRQLREGEDQWECFLDVGSRLEAEAVIRALYAERLSGFRAAREAAAEVLAVQIEMAGTEADAAMVTTDWPKVDRERHLLKYLRSTRATINAIKDPQPGDET